MGRVIPEIAAESPATAGVAAPAADPARAAPAEKRLRLNLVGFNIPMRGPMTFNKAIILN
jgi:hypothetical protein